MMGTMEEAAESFSYRASLAADDAELSDEVLAKRLLAIEDDLCFLQARRAMLMAEVESRHPGVPTADAVGPLASPSTSRWFAHETRRSQKMAGGIVNDGVRLAELPDVLEAFVTLRIRPHHVREILAAFRKQPDTVTAAQLAIVGWAQELDWADFTQRLQALLELMDDVDPAEAALRRFNKRGLHCTQVDDMATYLLTTTPEVRAVLDDAIAVMVKKLRDHDWAELVATYGDDASWDKAVRNDAQRRHDALFMLVTSGAVSLDPSGSFVVNVVLDHDTLMRETERLHSDPEPMEIEEAVVAAERHRSCSMRGRPIPTVIAMRMAIAGHVRRILYTAPSTSFDISKKRRLYAGLLRLGIMLRHPRCVEPGCDAPSIDCEIDHITPSARGGSTVDINGAPRCRRCHQWKTMLEVLGLA